MELQFIVPLFLLIVGFSGVIIGRRNIILILISLELMLLALTLHYVFIGWGGFGDLKILWLSIVMLTIGASESALGLAFIIAYFKTLKNY